MTLYKFFKTKQKLRRKDAQRSSTSDLDTSVGILAPPFPPLLSRAKSPSDILDFVGYPRLQVRHPPSPLPLRQVPSTTTNAPLTIRNKTPPNTTATATAEQVAQPIPPDTTDVQTKTKTATTPSLTSAPLPRDTSGFHMPTPKKALAPTWRILNADQAEKTLIAEDPEKLVKFSGDILHVNRLQQQVMDFERERQAWARREEEHRHLEQQMLQTIQDNQAKIDQLSNPPQKRPVISNNHHSNRTSFDSFVSQHQSTPSYVDDNGIDGTEDDDDDDDESDDNGGYSTFDNTYQTYHTSDVCQPNNTYMDPYQHYNHIHDNRNHNNNRLLLFAPMDNHQYQQIQQRTRYNDDDDDDDDDRSEDSYQHNSISTRQYQPYLEDTNYGDDEDDDINDDQDEIPLDDNDDDTYRNLGPWQHSQRKAMYGGDYWCPPPLSRRRRSSIQQQELPQQRSMIYYPPITPHSIYYQQHQRPTSAHVLQEHHRHRNSLRRHHSFGSDPNQVYYQHQAYKNRRSYRV